MGFLNRTLTSAAVMTFALAAASTASAQATFEFHLPAQPLGVSLRAVGSKTHSNIVFSPDSVHGKTAPVLQGTYSPQAALEALLRGSGLSIATTSGGSFLISSNDPKGTALADETEGDPPNSPDSEILVTGTRLKQVAIASHVTTITSQQMIDQGQTSVTQALADLPENFGGGQNPNVGLGVPGGQNYSGASTINLRGIGGDATLTLLNGHRLAYNTGLQSIDIGGIPFLAVDRIEIVADGSSALYGSDAVAGVANIILRRDYDGLITDMRIGGATDGGDFQQQYGLLAGHRWSGGGFALSYEFERETPVEANDRSYARDLAPGLQLTPFLKHHDGALSFHQDLAPDLSFSADLVANQRWNSYHYAEDARGDYRLFGEQLSTKDFNLAASPSLNWTIGSGWSASLSGTYAIDHDHYRDQAYGAYASTTLICLCNAAKSVEASANGPIFDLPGGPVQVAIGGGYRSNRFVQSNIDVHVTDGIAYLFGETEIPFVSAANAMPLIQQLSLSAAARYEHYRGGGDVTTPKLGIVYAPTHDLQLKASWGKSYKAPTLFQQYNNVRVGYYPAIYLGGTAATPPALLLVGGSRDLQPERARTWSTGLTWQPSALPGLKLEASYFDINYRNRVVSPITYSTQALISPLYAGYVTPSPTAAQIDQALARGQFVNVVGTPFDPTNISAIVDDRSVNAGRQLLNGADVAVHYAIATGGSQLDLSGSATYLRSRQQLTPAQPVLPLAGTLFNPPHWRSRDGVVWSGAGVTLSTFVNYIGSVRDVRSSPAVTVSSMTTVDVAARYALPVKSGALAGTEVRVSAQNLFNAKPGLISGTTYYEQPYDSTNYSPVGRLISVGITKRW